jgi:hypothetical protein
MSDTAVIESTPAAAVPPPDALSKLTPSERTTWRLTGELPATPPDTGAAAAAPDLSTDADSSPAEPATQVASTEASQSPASKPGTPKKANAETRKAELQAEIKGLIAQRDALRSEVAPPVSSRPDPVPDAPAASSPAPVSMDQAILSPNVSSPALTESQFFERFPDAGLSDYVRYAARYEVKREQQETNRAATIHRQASAFRQVVDAEIASDPDFTSVLNNPAIAVLKPLAMLQPNETAGPLNVAAQEIIESPNAAKLLRHLHEHPEVMQAIRNGSDRDAIRIVTQIDARLSAPSVPTQPVVKTTTSAPPPAETLGRKPQAPVDDVQAAMATGDVRAYMRAMNRREVGAS